jgi:hypothetical protein
VRRLIEDTILNLVPIFIFAFVIGIIILAVVVTNHFEKKRREAIKQFAAQRGFTYEEEHEGFGDGATIFGIGVGQAPLVNGSNAQPWLNDNLFLRGHSRHINNYLSKNTDEQIIFDYTYTVGSGKHKSTYYQTVFVIKNKPAFADFQLSRENIFDKMLSVIGFKDINFDADSDFSKKYLLKGKDEQGIRKIFNPEARRNLLLNNRFGNINSINGYTLLYFPSKTIKPEEFGLNLDSAIQINNLLARDLK